MVFMHSTIHRCLLTGSLALLLVALGSPSGWTEGFGGTGKSGSTTGGATRGGCPVTAKPLTALVPSAAPGGGWTASAHPTVWVYVPYTLNASQSLEFVLRDAQDNDVYQTKISGAHVSPGIVRVTLPKDPAIALQVDNTYTWYVMANCSKTADRPAMVSGTIKRVAIAPELQAQLNQSAPAQRSTLAIQQGLWYEAMTALGEELLTHPNQPQLMTQWRALLRRPDVGLDAYATEPLSACCQTANR